jgi:hypothetical protein
VLIEPELHARGTVAGGFQQVGQHVLVAAQHVGGEAQAVDERDRKREVDRGRTLRFAHNVHRLRRRAG